MTVVDLAADPDLVASQPHKMLHMYSDLEADIQFNNEIVPPSESWHCTKNDSMLKNSIHFPAKTWKLQVLKQPRFPYSQCIREPRYSQYTLAAHP